MKPPPAELPYYLSAPRLAGERAPGWYARLNGDAGPLYLGANAVDAEIFMLGLIEGQRRVKV